MTVTIENTYTGDGSTTDRQFTFPYLDTTDIKVSLDGVVTTAYTLHNATTVRFNTAPNNGVAIRIYRETAYENPKATFYPGSAIRAGDLNDNTLQNLYVNQESNDKVANAWLSGDPTVISTESWYTTDDTKIATTKAVENRIDAKIDTALTTDVVGGTAITVTDDSPSTGKITLAVTAGSIGTTQLATDAVTGAKVADDAIDSEHLADGSIDAAHLSTGSVTHVKLGSDCVDGDNIQDDAINSEHLAAGSIDTEHIASSQVTHVKLASDCIDGDNIQDDVVNSEHYAAGSIDHEHLANDIIDGDNIQDDVINSEHIAAGAVDLEHMSANSVDSDQYVDGSIDRIHLSADIIDATKIADNAVTTDHIQDAELTTLAGMQSGTASILADSTELTATTAELNLLDNKTFRASGDGSLTTTSDTEIPSSKVIASHVSSTILATGGFISINNEVSFPVTASQPANGVIVSISDAAGTVINGSGTSTTGRTTDGSPATVTINNFPSSLYSETLATGVGLLVTSTGSSNIYNYHKILAAEADVKQLSDDINDFNARYRVAGSAPGSNNDAGDLYFDTATNKMKVYNATTSAWDDVASVGNFFINTISSSSNTGGGSATFNGSAYRFTLSNPPTMAQQLIVSVNGVLQKPDAGSSQPSEGFAINGNDIIFSAAPASSSDYFIVTQGSSVSIGTPSDNTVSTAKIQNLGVTTAKLAAGAVTNAKITDDTIAEVKLDVHNAPATGKYLKYTSNGMEWSDGASEGTDVKSTGESGGNKFLREDGDGTSSWQAVDTDKIEEGNTSVETIDTGSDGHVKITTEGTERLLVNSDGVKVTGRQDVDTAGGDAYWNKWLSSGSMRAYLYDYPTQSSVMFGCYTSTHLDLFTNNAVRLRIGNSGQLGIGGATYGTSGQVLTSGGASAAPSWADATSAAMGYDMWCLDAHFPSSGYYREWNSSQAWGSAQTFTNDGGSGAASGGPGPATMSISRCTTSQNPLFAKVGTGMSMSAGVWTFPNTGQWRVTFSPQSYEGNSSHNSGHTLYLWTTSNNGTDWHNAHRSHNASFKDQNEVVNYQTIVARVNITDTSNQKIYFSMGGGDGRTQVYGSNSRVESFFMFEQIS